MTNRSTPMFGHADELPTKFIFVSGVMRSGTTLLQRIVATYPGCNGMSPEIQSTRLVAYNYHHKSHVGQMTLDQARREMIEEVRKFWIQRGRHDTLVAKDPLMIEYVEDFIKILPEVLIVLSLRDPRDIINSVINVRKQADI